MIPRQVKIYLKHFFNLLFSNNLEKTGYVKNTTTLFRMQTEFRAFFRPFLKRMQDYRGRPISVIAYKLSILTLPFKFFLYSCLFFVSTCLFLIKFFFILVGHYTFRFWKVSLELGFMWGDFLYTVTVIARYFLLFIIKKPIGFFTVTSRFNFT